MAGCKLERPFARRLGRQVAALADVRASKLICPLSAAHWAFTEGRSVRWRRLQRSGLRHFRQVRKSDGRDTSQCIHHTVQHTESGKASNISTEIALLHWAVLLTTRRFTAVVVDRGSRGNQNLNLLCAFHWVFRSVPVTRRMRRVCAVSHGNWTSSSFGGVFPRCGQVHPEGGQNYRRIGEVDCIFRELNRG